jgi:class 3 adenylate cyclase
MKPLTRLLLKSGYLEPVNKTTPIKYVYADIVDYTQNRSAEAQCDLVGKLNALFEGAIRQSYIKRKDCIFIPTGDGICLALPKTPKWDLESDIQLALSVLAQLQDHNDTSADDTRRFTIRIGINENVDNLITDINGKPNVAGLGVNMAQRIMGKADGNQILLGQAVYERLRAREKYMRSFREFQATVKHGDRIRVYQYIDTNAKGLNNEMPSAFAPPPTPKQGQPMLTKLAAYYLAHCITNRDFLLSVKDSPAMPQTAVVLLFALAEDSVESSEANVYSSPIRTVFGEPDTPFEKQFLYYEAQDFWTVAKLCHFIEDGPLKPFMLCFEQVRYAFSSVFVSHEGIEKLKNEWPAIAKELGVAG